MFQKKIKRFFWLTTVMMGYFFTSHLYAETFQLHPSEVTINNPIDISKLNVNPDNPNVVKMPDLDKFVVQNVCGNEVVEPNIGEECDGGTDCDANCKKILINPPPTPPAGLQGNSDNSETSNSSGGCNLGSTAGGSLGNILMIFSLLGTLLIRRFRK